MKAPSAWVVGEGKIRALGRVAGATAFVLLSLGYAGGASKLAQDGPVENDWNDSCLLR